MERLGWEPRRLVPPQRGAGAAKLLPHLQEPQRWALASSSEHSRQQGRHLLQQRLGLAGSGGDAACGRQVGWGPGSPLHTILCVPR